MNPAASGKTMKIYLIYGERDSGKTNTCAKILKSLIALGASVNFYETFKWEGDFKTVTAFQGKTIGIYSPGDSKAQLQAAINMGKNKGCDILIATIRKNIAYKDVLEKCAARYPQEWMYIEKGNNENEMERIETQMALEMLNKIYTEIF